VKGTAAGERIARAVVRDQDVPDLGVHEPVQQPPARHHATADPGADRDVTERVESHRGAPTLLAERRRVDVGVERDGHVERTLERGDDIGVRPARLGRGGDAAQAEVERPE